MKQKTKPVRLVNLTPHPIEVGDLIIPMSGMIARVEENQVNVEEIKIENPDLVLSQTDKKGYVVQIINKKWERTNGLPPEQEGTIYIVSTLVMIANPDRKDLICPSTKPTKKRRKWHCRIFIRRDPKCHVDIWSVLRDVERSHGIKIKWPCDQIGMELAAKMGLEIPK